MLDTSVQHCPLHIVCVHFKLIYVTAEDEMKGIPKVLFLGGDVRNLCQNKPKR